MNTPENIAYTAKAEITGGRDGRGATDDKAVDVSLRTPKEQGGPGGGTNPEQLFAVGYGACFQSALGLAGKEMDVDTSGRSEEHTSELQSRGHLVCRLLLEKKKKENERMSMDAWGCESECLTT